MSPRITHSKVSGKPNPTDASKVGGEDWDADHVIDGLTIGTDVQAHDTTLDALAAFDSNGILVQYGTDQFTARTLTGTANEITVTNGAGASGNPTISLPSALTFTGKTVTGGTFNDILSLTAHTAGASLNPLSVDGRLAKFYDGSASSPVTSGLPSVAISRYESVSTDTQGVQNPALLVEAIGNNVGGSPTPDPQTLAIRAFAEQKGTGDVLGIASTVIQNNAQPNSGRIAYGYYANVWAKGSASAAYGMETHIFNDAAATPYATGTTPYHVGAVYFAGGAFKSTAGIYFAPTAGSTQQWDVGIAFRAGSIATATLWDDSSSVTTLRDKGSHTDGIDLSAATYSGSPFKSTGFSVSNIGGVTADTVLVKSVLALDHANADVELGSTTASGTPLIDFHSSGNNIDYDARIIASGGTGVAGNGTLSVAAAVFALPGVTTIGGVQAVSISASQTLTNKSMDGGSNTFTNIPASAIVSAALTRTNDTNVTLTLGGSPTTALLNAASITVGWSGTLAPSRGGTGISSLGTGVATALGINVGSAGAPVINGGALGSPSSIGTLPAFTLGGAISGGGNQINNVIIGASTPLAGSFTTIAGTDIASSGYVQAAATSGYKLGSNVVLDTTGFYTRLKAPDGNQGLSFGSTANDPSAYFDNDTSAFRSRGAGSNYTTITSSGVNIQSGNLLKAGTQVVGARDTGWGAMTGTANKNTAYDTSTVTLAQLAGRVMSLQAALTTHGLIGT